MAGDTAEGRTVGAVAALVGVTIRTLHHWDEIGLVCPSDRTPGGYRLYTPEDVTRIHRVLIYRELDVPLTDIAALLDAPASDATASLRRQREQLRARMAHLQSMSDALDRLIEARQSGLLLSAEEQVAIFGAEWQPGWVSDAHSRWAETPQWAQYAERSADRTPAEWREITDAVNALNAELAEAFRRGVPPGTAEADALAERHRASIGQYFDCTHAMQVCIARMYVDDSGYADFYNALAPGLNIWLRRIIDANARAHGVDPDTAASS
ncbi:MerR family transcriptional regulator [Nocardia acidivorans]|uniref:MerR family transcriptional regulator n=1 Tax=Nocardia acidivorans TaxID=404580 RepID=UPI0008297126|nr:MerR family transcriptional regulator [Nocardia acidivorans]